MKNARRWERMCGKVAKLAERAERAETVACQIAPKPEDMELLLDLALDQTWGWTKVARKARKLRELREKPA